MTSGDQEVIYEVECTLDPGIVADFDAWLPDHVRAVVACSGFTGAEIQTPVADAEGPPVRRTQYRLQNRAALDRYLAEDAARMRADGLARFGDQASFTRRVLEPAGVGARLPEAQPSCQNCGGVVTGKYCASCGQAGHVHLMTIGDVTHDVVHSALHLDSRVWSTLRSLVLRPGELTNEFIAGRRQRYLPPFRLYLVISIAFFALSSLLPDAQLIRVDGSGRAVVAPVTIGSPGAQDARQSAAEAAQELEQLAADPETPALVREIAGHVQHSVADAEGPADDCSVAVGWPPLARLLAEACRKAKQDQGRQLANVFLNNAPKLMFVFLPLMAAVALLFYWRPRRLYAEHLVLFLHVHAFLFLWLIVTSTVNAVSRIDLPLVGALGLLNFALAVYLPWYVLRAMRVVYRNGRALTAIKFVALSAIYFTLLGVTMIVGIIYSMLSL